MAQPILTLADWSRIKALNSVHTISPGIVPELANCYQTFCRNTHVCTNCPSDLMRALHAIKDLYKRSEAEWNAKEREAIKEQERRDLEGWIGGAQS